MDLKRTIQFALSPPQPLRQRRGALAFPPSSLRFIAGLNRGKHCGVRICQALAHQLFDDADFHLPSLAEGGRVVSLGLVRVGVVLHVVIGGAITMIIAGRRGIAAAAAAMHVRAVAPAAASLATLLALTAAIADQLKTVVVPSVTLPRVNIAIIRHRTALGRRLRGGGGHWLRPRRRGRRCSLRRNAGPRDTISW